MDIKSPKTYEQQIDRLREKNIIVNDEESAKTFLNKVNYYRFSGYFLPFIKTEDGNFFVQVNFEQLKAIYEFDSKMRNIIAFAIEEIEVYLKTQFSTYHAFKYGAEGYMDKDNFNKNHNAKRFQERLESCVNENKSTLIVKHHFANYGGKFPIWVIIDFFQWECFLIFIRI